MSTQSRSIFLLSLGLLVLLLCTSSLALAHGGEQPVEEQPVSLSLESILVITVLVGIGLLVFISLKFGVDDTRFLVKIAIIALLLLILDYIYIRFYR